jgi:hypothetical protein
MILKELRTDVKANVLKLFVFRRAHFRRRQSNLNLIMDLRNRRRLELPFY